MQERREAAHAREERGGSCTEERGGSCKRGERRRMQERREAAHADTHGETQQTSIGGESTLETLRVSSGEERARREREEPQTHSRESKDLAVAPLAFVDANA
jgi:hypothetical protein